MAVMCWGFAESLLLSLFVLSTRARDTQYITGTSTTGVTQLLAVDRIPALYTGDFGECLGGQSLFNITKFDAAYYTDNSTVLFHLDGLSSVHNESLMVQISMDAYGENRFQMTFDPCLSNIYSLCPADSSVPITAWAFFAVGPQQVGDIPNLAFTIPDFEGSVRLKIFGNTSQSEIGCFQARLTNGATLAHPEAVSPVLAVFTMAAMMASFSAAVYGGEIPTMRTHYAHSLPVMVIFEAFQSIFLSGALELNFPSMLVAWWSNFAWSAGQIYSASVIRLLDTSFHTSGNASQAGDARSTARLEEATGESLAHEIYSRFLLMAGDLSGQLMRKQPFNASNPYDYTWAGVPAQPGVALPGTWTGFPGTLAALNIPAAGAFSVGLIWFLVFLGVLILLPAVFKFFLEVLAKLKHSKENSLIYFRRHWIAYTIVIIFRTMFAAFSIILTLAFFQFSFGGSAGAKALAAVFFLVFFIGVSGLAVHACRLRLKNGHYVVESDRIIFTKCTAMKIIPCIAPVRLSTLKEMELREKTIGSMPYVRFRYHSDDPGRVVVHQDEAYIKRFGWLSARYRRTRWWFFAFYLGYQFVRAAIVGGGASTPAAQVYCLLVYDILAFFIILAIDPFEGNRNTALAVWLLGLSKVLTTALSVAFLPTMDVDRITATVIGVVVIIIQGLLTIGILVLAILSVISSYISVTQDKERFVSTKLEPIRARYLEHLDKTAADNRISRAQKERQRRIDEAEAIANAPRPSFSVKSVRRVSKIYDEDDDSTGDQNRLSISDPADPRRLSRPRPSLDGSIRSTHSLPRGARSYRNSWSSQELADYDAVSLQRADGAVLKRLSYVSGHGQPFSLTLDSHVEEETAHNNVKEKSSTISLSPKSPTTPGCSEPSSSTTAVQT